MNKKHCAVLGLTLVCSVLNQKSLANELNEVDYLSAVSDDSLLDDDADFNESDTSIGAIEELSYTKPVKWTQGFKSQMKHDMTKSKAAGDIERSQIGIEYQGSFISGWYMNFKALYRYYGDGDVLAQDRGGAYGRKKVQRLWLQYSQSQCAHTLGRQALVWGEVDGTFIVDVITPLDFSEQLFTDYDEVRVAQDMWVMDCYLENVQVQFFLSHKSKTHVLPENNIHIDNNHEELGGRIKLSLTGLDLTLMMAQLYSNMPVVNTQTLELASSKYELMGISFSKAQGRLLLNGDMAYKTNQINSLPAEAADTFEVAFGVEYTRADNQNFNAGVWQVKSLGSEINNRPLAMTLGWRQNYLYENLAMSLLSNLSQQPDLQSVTLLGAYKLTDIFTVSSAVSFANRNEEEFSVLQVPAKQAWSVSIKIEI